MQLKKIEKTRLISHVPDVICFASVHHINMDRLSATPTRSLIRYASLVRLSHLGRLMLWPSRGIIRVKCLS